MEGVVDSKQEQRTLLRERFLRMMGTITSNMAVIDMYQKTRVSCRLGPVDIDMQHVQVTDLQTPMGLIPQAVLRSSDIIGFTIPELKTTEKQTP